MSKIFFPDRSPSPDQPDELRRQDRLTFYGLDDVEDFDDLRPYHFARYEQCLMRTPDGLCRLVKGHRIHLHEVKEG